MAKGKSKGKSAEKKQTNWTKIAVSLFLAITMIIVIFAYALNGGGPKTLNTDRTLTLMKGFNTISDGMKLVPDNASYVRYANLTADPTLSNWMHTYFWTSMPNSSTFNTQVKKDMLTVYPKDNFGNFSTTYGRNFSMQYVSLTDFGTGAINESYPALSETVDGQTILYVNYLYFFTPQTNPVVNGMGEMVIPVLDTMTGKESNSSYVQYKGLIDQLHRYGMSEDGMTLQVVGDKPASGNYSDMYYAAIGPNNDANKTYTFQAVMHLNRSLTNTELGLFSILPDVMKEKGYTSYNVSYTNGEAGDYIVIKAVGPFDQCTYDMFYSDSPGSWGFMRY